MVPGSPASPSCPPPSRLRQFLACEVTDTDREKIGDHVDQCPRCRERVDALSREHESWVSTIQAAGAPPPGPRTPVRPDIPGYTIEEEISRGGQGVVLRAIQQSTRREVAIKVLRDGAYASDAARRRFEREVELAASLGHPSIVPVFDSGFTESGAQYCVMDYVRGQHLDRFVAGRATDVRAIVDLWARVCEAVSAAHQRGVIHRDLKPSNILVPDDGLPRILDFGLAKQAADEAESRLTTSGVVAGTLAYMSPEQASGAVSAGDVRSDVYALGVIGFEMLTGALPHDVTGTAASALRAIAEQPPVNPAVALRQGGRPYDRLDDELETIILKALARDPDRRYQSAHDLAADLRRHLAGEPVEAKRDSTWYLVRKAIRRHRLVFALSAAFVLLLAVSVLALSVLYGRQGQLLEEVQAQTAAARAAEADARQRLEQLRGLTWSFVVDMDRRIRDLPGSTPAREFVVDRGLEYLAMLSEGAADNVKLKAELGAAYCAIGDILGDPQRPNLGKPERALELYDQAIAWLEEVTASGGHAGYALSLHRALMRRSQVLQVLRRPDEAQQAFDRARVLVEDLAERYPKDREVRTSLHTVYERLGNRLLGRGEYDEAMAYFRKTLAPDDSPQADTRDQAIAYRKIANVLLSVGKVEEALAHHRRYVEIMEDVVARRPDHAVNVTDLGWGHERVSLVLHMLGRDEEALEAARRGLELHERMSSADAHNARSQSGVRTCLCRMGEAQLGLGRRDDARESFRKFRDAAAGAVEDAPDDPAVQRELAVAHYKLAECHMAAGGDESLSESERRSAWSAAAEALASSVAIFERLASTGDLASGDAGVPAELKAEREACLEKAAGAP